MRYGSLRESLGHRHLPTRWHWIQFNVMLSCVPLVELFMTRTKDFPFTISFYLHQNPFNHEHSNGKTQEGGTQESTDSQRRKIVRYTAEWSNSCKSAPCIVRITLLFVSWWSQPSTVFIKIKKEKLGILEKICSRF